MYYAQRGNIKTNETYLDVSHVFSGQYWDDFGITPYLTPDSGRVLLLGLGAGGGIRPILASTNKISLTCVDIDPATTISCRNYFTRKFPLLQFASHTADAMEFIDRTEESYDVVWVDIYQSAAYSTLTTSFAFFERLAKLLRPGGKVLVNGYGLPFQFNPVSAGPQRYVADALVRVFPFVSFIPHRRNLTFVAARERPQLFEVQPDHNLRPIDRIAFAAMKLRLIDLEWRRIDKVPLLEEARREPLLFAAIDADMRAHWGELCRHLQELGFNVAAPLDLVSFIQNQSDCSRYLTTALEAKDSRALFIPILAAGESNLRDMAIDWLFDWLLANETLLSNSSPADYRQVWLSQMWSVVLQPNGRYRSHAMRMKKLIQEAMA